MPVYAVGDLQGCLEPLRRLLDQIAFDPSRDRLWLVGDLVNRGPHSLDALRFVKGMGESAVTVLGNHDLNLLAVAAGSRELRRKDTLRQILDAPDRDELLDWLRHRPLLHRDPALGFTMVHAGLPPQWSVDDAVERARELEAVMQGPRCKSFLANMYGDEPVRWKEKLKGWNRLRFITNCFTRLRYCDADGRLSMSDKGPPGSQSKGMMPWFEVPGRRSRGEKIVFGHWATLQTQKPLWPFHHAYHLDSGCVWGGYLTALRLDDVRYFRVDCAAEATRSGGTTRSSTAKA